MNPTHDQLLADLEARVRRPDLSIDELDGRVAAALGVGVEDYRAYLAVRGALEARKQLMLSAGDASPVRSPSRAEALDRLRRQVEVVAGLVTVLYQRASDAGDRHSVSAAARILGTMPALRYTLATLDACLHHRPRRSTRRG